MADALSTAFREKKPDRQSNLGLHSIQQYVASCKRTTKRSREAPGSTERCNTGLKIISNHCLQWQMDFVKTRLLFPCMPEMSSSCFLVVGPKYSSCCKGMKCLSPVNIQGKHLADLSPPLKISILVVRLSLRYPMLATSLMGQFLVQEKDMWGYHHL